MIFWPENTMNRATILQRTIDAATAASGMQDAPRMPDAIAGRLYVYCVKRKFPSAEVLRNKLMEWDGMDGMPKPFDEEPEEVRLFLNGFRAAAQQLEEVAQETIGEFEADMAGGEDAGDTNEADLGGMDAAGGNAAIASPENTAPQPSAPAEPVDPAIADPQASEPIPAEGADQGQTASGEAVSEDSKAGDGDKTAKTRHVK